MILTMSRSEEDRNVRCDCASVHEIFAQLKQKLVDQGWIFPLAPPHPKPTPEQATAFKQAMKLAVFSEGVSKKFAEGYLKECPNAVFISIGGVPDLQSPRIKIVHEHIEVLHAAACKPFIVVSLVLSCFVCPLRVFLCSCARWPTHPGPSDCGSALFNSRVRCSWFCFDWYSLSHLFCRADSFFTGVDDDKASTGPAAVPAAPSTPAKPAPALFSHEEMERVAIFVIVWKLFIFADGWCHSKWSTCLDALRAVLLLCLRTRVRRTP